MKAISCFCSKSGLTHDELVRNFLQYVFGKLEISLRFDGKMITSDYVIRYTDSDFAGSKPDQIPNGD